MWSGEKFILESRKTIKSYVVLWNPRKDEGFKRVEGEPWPVGLSGLSANLQGKGPPVRFPVRPSAWVVGQVPRSCLLYTSDAADDRYVV